MGGGNLAPLLAACSPDARAEVSEAMSQLRWQNGAHMANITSVARVQLS